ncbi:Cytochrome c oxidase polypeptide I [Carbonactinospora thermoautotrophica]|uniref:Cytochrome c oxidase polypeptide I n=1 Tax=Carbonactinospora thermoautotrophica TaxID=1469144 RepID=A0A132MTG9_9ACTN|nr:Cytochrome c oxidase polypeptide I [Carbonactinospora thermoautotrophica]
MIGAAQPLGGHGTWSGPSGARPGRRLLGLRNGGHAGPPRCPRCCCSPGDRPSSGTRHGGSATRAYISLANERIPPCRSPSRCGA